MSDIRSEASDDDVLHFDNRTTNANFQERLLQAQSMDDSINEGIRFEDFNFTEDTEELKKKKNELEKQVKHMESRVAAMEKKLATRREKRNKEAGLTNMTPEERAAYVEQEEEKLMKKRAKQEKLKKKQQIEEMELDDDPMQVSDTDEEEEEEDAEEEEEEEEDPDWDVVFEYMLLLGSDDSNQFSGTDYLQPNADLRQKALVHEDVLRQTRYSSLKITEAKNTLEHNSLEDVDIRHCDLTGTCYDQKFRVTFDVLEPAMTMSNLDFEVEIEMQLDIGDILHRIKDECHIMGFFRVFVHYATLDKQRKDVLHQLTKHYKGTSIHVEALSPSRLKLEGNTDYGINLIFSWTMLPTNVEKETLEANIETHVEPKLTLEAVAHAPVLQKDKDGILEKVNDVFKSQIGRQGVFKSIDYIVNKVLI